MHLNIDEIVDLADGTRSEASTPHLAACEPCRAQVRELRATLSAAQEVDVPEPSPLFWDHLSSRVREAVAVDARFEPSRAFFGGVTAILGARAFQGIAVVAAGVLLAVVLSSRATPPVLLAPPAVSVADAGANELLGDMVSGDDASLSLVASLMDDVDLETVREAGLAPRGSAEHAVTHMSDSELRELGRLLKEELARPGA